MIELKFPLRVTANGSFESITSYEEVWKQRVVAAISTTKGSRVMRPTFGASLNELLFMNEPTAIEAAADYVGSVFLSDLPELTLERVDGEYDSNQRTVVLSLTFRLPNREETSTIVFVNTDALNGGDL